jgi:hypothetical protein
MSANPPFMEQAAHIIIGCGFDVLDRPKAPENFDEYHIDQWRSEERA